MTSFTHALAATMIFTLTLSPQLAEAQRRGAPQARDSIVGTWKLDSTNGESYEYMMTIRPDGTVKYRVIGDSFSGNWKHLEGGRYRVSPGQQDDYTVLRNGKLEQWDGIGFIRVFNRVTPTKTTRSVAAPDDAPERRRTAEAWMYANFTPGMWWKRSTIREFVAHVGSYNVHDAKAPNHRAFYFPRPDMTIIVDYDRGVAMSMSAGRVEH